MNNDQIIQIRKLTRQYAYTALQMHESIAHKAGFSATDHKYLGFFVQKGKLTAGQLAQLTGLTTGAVTGLIDRFEKKGLVKRERDKTDRRKVFIVPDSQKITTLLAKYYTEFQTKTDALVASFSDEDLKVIEAYFSKSIALMNEIKNKLQ